MTHKAGAAATRPGCLSLAPRGLGTPLARDTGRYFAEVRSSSLRDAALIEDATLSQVSSVSGDGDMFASGDHGPGPCTASLSHHAGACECDHSDLVLLRWRTELQRRGANHGSDWDVQCARRQLLSFAQLLRAVREHYRVAALRRGNF